MRDLPMPELARKQHDLAVASLRPRPATEQQLNFFFAPNQRGLSGCVKRFETALDNTRPKRSPRLHPLGNALHLRRAKILALEQVADQ